jgi:hypothetical protein
MDNALVRRLETLEPPSSEAPCERAKLAVRAHLSTRAGHSLKPNLLAPTSLRLGVAILTLCAALSAAALFTSPGQAVSSWIGDRLGFGQPGGPPTLRDLRAFATEGSASEGQPAYVLLRRPAPGFGHYELITYRMKDEPGKLWPANGARCYELNFPEMRSIGGPRCGLPSTQNPLLFDGVGSTFQLEREPLIHISGRVSDEVDSVEIEFQGSPVQVDLAPIPNELIEQFRIRRSFKFFLAFMRDAERGGPVTITARDAAGRPLDHRRTVIPDFVEMQKPACQMARQLARKHKLKPRNIRSSCQPL